MGARRLLEHSVLDKPNKIKKNLRAAPVDFPTERAFDGEANDLKRVGRVADGEIASEICARGRRLAQHTRAKAVHRMHGHVPRRFARDRFNTFDHFAAGAVCKGKAEDFLRRRGAGDDQVCHTARERICFSGSRAGKQKDAVRRIPDYGALLFVWCMKRPRHGWRGRGDAPGKGGGHISVPP